MRRAVLPVGLALLALIALLALESQGSGLGQSGGSTTRWTVSPL